MPYRLTPLLEGFGISINLAHLVLSGHMLVLSLYAACRDHRRRTIYVHAPQ